MSWAVIAVFSDRFDVAHTTTLVACFNLDAFSIVRDRAGGLELTCVGIDSDFPRPTTAWTLHTIGISIVATSNSETLHWV